MGNINEFCKCEQKDNSLLEYNLTSSQNLPEANKETIIDEIVNYQSEKNNVTPQKMNNDNTSQNIKITPDEKWKKFDISFLIDENIYDEINDDKVIYSNEYEVEEIIKGFNKELHQSIHSNCVIKKKTFQIFQYTSLSSSLLINSTNINTQKITTDVHNLCPLYEINLVDDKIVTLVKYRKFINDIEDKSFVYLKYISKNSNTKEILISNANNSNVNFIIKLISFLSDIDNESKITS